jgi:hypothetical protein
MDRRVKPGDDGGGCAGARDLLQFRAFSSAKNTYPRPPNRTYLVRALLIEGVVLSGVR